MGLLGDSKLINSNIIKHFKDPVLLLIYLVGVVWFFLLSHESINASTYFSENALLPGLVDSEVYYDNGASQMSDELEALLKERRAAHNYAMPVEWLMEKLSKQGLPAFAQNYTFSYPHGVYSQMATDMKGTNVYTIIRAPRSSSTEALVINVPFNNHPSTSLHPNQPSDPPTHTNHPAIALIITLAKAFRKKSYWAKDLVFVVSDNNEVGIQAWLSSYHHVPNQYIKAQMLPARSGVIQAAIVLELQDKINSYFTLKTEGINGKLPNLDLFNTVERMFSKERGRIHMQEAHNSWLLHLRTSRRWQQFVNMATMVWRLASNYPTGNHGFFSTYSIDAVTIKGVEKKGSRQFELVDVGRVTEGILRSLNNLLERFHQSFFFYLLPSPYRYVSIGVYLPPIGLMLLPLIIKILRIKMEILDKNKKSLLKAEHGGEMKGEDGKEGEEMDTSMEGEEGGVGEDNTLRRRGIKEAKEAIKKDMSEEEGSTETTTEESTQDIPPQHQSNPTLNTTINDQAHSTAAISVVSDDNILTTSLFSLFLHSSMALIVPCTFYYSSDLFIRSARSFHVEAEDSVSMCLIVCHLAIVAYPFIFKWYTRTNPLPFNHAHLHLITLICMGFSCGALSVVNVSLSFLVLLCWTPLALLSVSSSSYKIMSWLKALMLLLLSPATLLYAATVANLYIATKAALPSPSAAFGHFGDDLMSSLLYYNLYNLWSFPLIYFLFLPLWSLMWMSAVGAC